MRPWMSATATSWRATFLTPAWTRSDEVLAEVSASRSNAKRCRRPDHEPVIGVAARHPSAPGACTPHPQRHEDHEVGLAYGLDVYSPVDDQVEFFHGQAVFDANPNVADKRRPARPNGAFQLSSCWRKRPVIFRATPQWVISMDKTGLREKSLSS